VTRARPLLQLAVVPSRLFRRMAPRSQIFVAALTLTLCLPFGLAPAAGAIRDADIQSASGNMPRSANPATSSSAITAQRCASTWKDAGFSSATAVTATAVGMGESACRSTATNSNGASPGCPRGSVDRGMWQINDCYHTDISASCAFDAVCSAKAAYRISDSGTDWRPWAAYTSGAYERHLSDAQAAVAVVYGR
jgi:hypothetical protein